MRRWGLLALLGMPVVLTACQAIASSNVPSARATVPVPSASRCSAGQLAVTWGGRFSEPTGQHTVPLTITNISSSGCSLFGYPQVALLDRTGRVLPLEYQTTGDQVVTAAPPAHVDLAPRGLAYVTVNKYRCDTTDLMQASILRLTPPGLTSSFSVSLAGNVPMDYCGPGDPGSIVHISPVAAMESATVAH
jgi:Protein of unknown function (DUF4232)